ncbi:T-lymphocyte activation antigen CD80 [Tiliqua scincoides]|uniref:T-lymphocyte activation antigen CD80 n=1 Tax=Tiliqua scincoides TaxID=71010 RepID=UPI0034634763
MRHKAHLCFHSSRGGQRKDMLRPPCENTCPGTGTDQMHEITIGEPVITKVGDVAKLSCGYKISGSLKPYKIYWQKHEKDKVDVVITAYVDGKENVSLKNPHFLNRSKMDEQDLTLSIFPVKVSDRGEYHCVIIRNFDIQRQCIVNLSVRADFSAPVITLSPSRCWQASLKLTCSSHGGYPEPKMSGFVSSDPSLEWIYHSTYDNKTQCFNIEGYLLINMTEEIIINCTVGYPGFQLSTILNVSRDCPLEQPPSHGVTIAIAVILTFVTLIVLTILFRCHSKYKNFSD